LKNIRKVGSYEREGKSIGEPEHRYEIRSEEEAVDVQIHNKVRENQ